MTTTAGVLPPRIEINEAACSPCGVCIDVCPTDVFVVDAPSGRPRVAWLEDCQVCFLCEIDCPTEAIRVWPAPLPRPSR